MYVILHKQSKGMNSASLHRPIPSPAVFVKSSVGSVEREKCNVCCVEKYKVENPGI